ncbi:rapamycin-insensitive companion of mTOR [Anopheles funestus]|uniref:rapamycin-insensitive companion of mTOR n=1 Tax=Anopheles funestus TaxID=62324 RepID=UPI0020C5F792|nr:rapamycin-insensitive companion of mTOR [Anopheles funestus]
MAMSSWMIRRSLRQRNRPAPEDCYRLDTDKTLRENATDIYTGLCSIHTTVNKRLSLLNGLVKLIDRWKRDAGLDSGASRDSSAPQSSRSVALHSAGRDASLGYTVQQWMCCIGRSLVHQLPQIRAGALRALRRLLLAPCDMRELNRLQLAHLVCRSLDVMLRNGEERIQALKLVRRMLVVAPDELRPAIVRCLVALCESGTAGTGTTGPGGGGGTGGGPGGGAGGGGHAGGSGEDRLLRCCLATLCEIGVLNPLLLIECGGVGVITRSVLECHSPRIAESLCGVLLYLLEWPRTRDIAGVRLDCFAAPYCDFTYRVGIMDRYKDARELRFTCSRLALLSVLRSWAGTIEFCDPHRPSGLRSLIDILYLNQLEIRKAVLDLLYELIGLPQPVWTDEYSVAMSVVDPAEYQDAWRLHEGFVAAEGTAILPSLAGAVPNLCEIHLALLLYCFVENGLLNALIEVIISSDTFISVRATILLARITHQLHCLLPAEICARTPTATLPMLVTRAIEGNHQARAAITALQQHHLMLQNRPASCSLYLDCIIQSGELINTRAFRRELVAPGNRTGQQGNGYGVGGPNAYKYGTLDGLKRVRHDSTGSSGGSGGLGGLFGNMFLSGGSGSGGAYEWNTSYDGSFVRDVTRGTMRSGTMKRTSKRNVLQQLWASLTEGDRLLKESNVLAVKDANMWDWDIIITILRSDLLGMKLDEQNTRFVRRIVDYFKPSNNRFSHQDFAHLNSNRQMPAYVTAGLELIDAMLQSTELEYIRILTDLFTDISRQLMAIHAKKSAHECLFSPLHMTGTMCQHYFLFIGRMCRTEGGLEILRNTDVFKELSTIVLKTNHLCYVKLIVSGLDYSLEGEPRLILAKALLRHPSPKARLYATQMLRVLLRARLPNFEVWGIQLMLKLVAAMLGDGQTRCVQMAALDLLEEACYERTYLEELAHSWPRLDRLGPRGKMVMMRFYSIPRGINHPEAHTVQELEQWVTVYNEQYVLLVESDTHAHLTQHIRTEDGTYSRRHIANGAPGESTAAGAPNLAPHLYGQLVQTSKGFSQLLNHGSLVELAERVRNGVCNNEQDCLRLKAALWALCHTCTSKEAIEYVNEHLPWLLPHLVQLVRTADVYSIRATALGGLCLVASTAQGADALRAMGWVAVRHDRNTHWPVNEPGCWETAVPAASSASTNESDGEGPGRRRHSFASTEDESTANSVSFLASSCLVTGDLSPIPSTSHPSSVEREVINGRKQHRHLFHVRRPLLSSSSADMTDAEDVPMQLDNSERLFSFFRTSTVTEPVDYGGKIRSLDRKYHRLSLQHYSLSEDGHYPSVKAKSSFFPIKTNTQGPCFIGICFPLDIMELFPELETRRPLALGSLVQLDRSKMRSKDSGRSMKVVKLRVKTGSDVEEGIAVDYEQEMKGGAPPNAPAPCSPASSNHDESESGDGRQQWWSYEKHNRSQCVRCCRGKRVEDRWNPADLDDSGRPVLDDAIANNVLRHVQRMANPVWSKQSRSVLLDIKQSHPYVFQDVCLYSEVCRLLGCNTYRLGSRRFLQELFLDLDFLGPCKTTTPVEVPSVPQHTTQHNTAPPPTTSKALHTPLQIQTQNLPAPGTIPGGTKSPLPGGLSAFLLRSPPLASVHEASVENLDEMSTTPKQRDSVRTGQQEPFPATVRDPPRQQSGVTTADDELTTVRLRDPHGTSTMPPPTTAHHHRPRSIGAQSGSGMMEPVRPRFNTLELDLSCSRNKFPIRDRSKLDYSPTTPPVAYGTGTALPLSASSSSASFISTGSASAVTSPTQGVPGASVTFYNLFCEQRLRLKSSKSEATLTKNP